MPSPGKKIKVTANNKAVANKKQRARPPAIPPEVCPEPYSTPATAQFLEPPSVEQVMTFLLQGNPPPGLITELRDFLLSAPAQYRVLPPFRAATHTLVLPKNAVGVGLLEVIHFRVETTDPGLLHEVALHWVWWILDVPFWPGPEPRFKIDAAMFADQGDGTWVAEFDSVNPPMRFGEIEARYWVEDAEIDRHAFPVV
jgi:hypothetical protein